MRTSKILKVLAYILIPLLFGIIVLNMICVSYVADNRQIFEKNSYVETSKFGDALYAEINDLKYYINNMVSTQRDENLISIFDSKYNEIINYKFVVIRKNDNATFSNVTTGLDDIESIKEDFKKYPYYLFCVDTIDSNINNQELKEKTYINTYNGGKFEIYIAFSSERDINYKNVVHNLFFEYAKGNQETIIYSIPVCIVIELLLIVYLLWAIGHNKGLEGIYQTKFDKWPTEIILALMIAMELFLLFIFSEILSMGSDLYISRGSEIGMLALSFAGIVAGIMYIILAIIGTSIVKKFKTRTFIKSSLVYIICGKLIKLTEKVFNMVSGNIGLNAKAIVLLAILSFSPLVLCLMFRGFGILLSIAVYIGITVYVVKRISHFTNIKNHLKMISSGKNIGNIDITEYKAEFKEIAMYINEISNGLENAVNEKLKSERLKTELITNVSHDIKTPLTSIINYVDLLKKEQIDDVKIKEYVDILDSKSQRLKKLIEDLVEASKVNSGNITLEKQKVNLLELINQTTGEFADKFSEKNLNVVINTNDKNEYNIMADTRYMYRIVENIFSNIYKYALEGSRVYIDINENKEKIKLEIKNISKDALNITEEELMERFVRGDRSRNTEGSGLGLSIAKSLTELQGGDFRIVIDGDLFKVEILF